MTADDPKTLAEYVARGGRRAFVGKGRPAFARGGFVPGAGHCSAVPTYIDGIRFPSKLQARVYSRLVQFVSQHDGGRAETWIFREVRVPLFALPSDERGKARTLSIDFVIRFRTGALAYVEAKAKRWKSRDWDRGRAAFEALAGAGALIVWDGDGPIPSQLLTKAGNAR